MYTGAYLTEEAFLDDIDLIHSNAVLYNPPKGLGQKIVDRAFDLKDLGHHLIDNAKKQHWSLMKECREIAAARKKRNEPPPTPTDEPVEPAADEPADEAEANQAEAPQNITVNEDDLRAVIRSLAARTDGCGVDALSMMLHAARRLVYEHRGESDKAALLEAIAKLVAE